jgi:hypothetical protein
MAEHALFFALLMPEELAAKERAEALEFSRSFGALFETVARPRNRIWTARHGDRISHPGRGR